MAPRICTSCDEPHLTSDWYLIAPLAEPGHPLFGHVECKPAYEDRIRRATRRKCEVPTFERFGHQAGIVRRGRVRYLGPGLTTRDDQ